jgi:hypothetical protein
VGKAIGGSPYLGLEVAHDGRLAEYPLGERANPRCDCSRHDYDRNERQAQDDPHRCGRDSNKPLIEHDLAIACDRLSDY